MSVNVTACMLYETRNCCKGFVQKHEKFLMISVPHLIEIHRLYLFTAALIRFHYSSVKNIKTKDFNRFSDFANTILTFSKAAAFVF